MYIEYEATFLAIDRVLLRSRLQEAGAILVKPETLMKRRVYNFPSGHEIEGGWLRVRDEGDRVTMSLKVVDGAGIADQKEICLTVDNFAAANEFLEKIGAVTKAYQESRRETWTLDGAEICLDEWPYLEPYAEVEGSSEETVRLVSAKLGLDYSQALFCSVAELYKRKYNISEDRINNNTSLISFDAPNPFAR